jgi:4-amino-4-deoxy-L-arabinose transferase-like glycosyltransferase
MIARNFVDGKAEFFFPRIDMAGTKTGIIGSEFPIYNYCIYMVSALFGYTHWYGRLINLIISNIGVYYFYKLIKGVFDKNIAFNATILLSASIWFSFSRKVMPDTLSVAIMLIALYHAYSYLKYSKTTGLIYFFVFSSLAMLIKIPALALLSIIAVVVFIKEISNKRKIYILATGFLSFIIACVWYFVWVPYLLKTYHYQLYFPKGIIEGITEILPLFPDYLKKFYFSALHSYIAFGTFVIGVYYLLKGKNKIVKYGIGIVTMVFIAFTIKTGAVFPLHNYYIIPFVPVMALIASLFISRIPTKYQYLLLVLISIEAIGNQQHDFFIKDSELYKLELEKLSDKYIPKDALIIINGGASPQSIYFSHRKGWTENSNKIQNRQFIDSLSNIGAQYLIIDNKRINYTKLNYNTLYSDTNYTIYSLQVDKN